MRPWLPPALLLACLCWSAPAAAQTSPLALQPPTLLQAGSGATVTQPAPPRLLYVFAGGVLYFGSLSLTEASLIRRAGNLEANDLRVVTRTIAATAADLCLLGAGATYLFYRKQRKAAASLSTSNGVFASLSFSL